MAFITRSGIFGQNSGKRVYLKELLPDTRYRGYGIGDNRGFSFWPREGWSESHCGLS